MVRRKTSTLLRASLTAYSLEGWIIAKISFMMIPERVLFFAAGDHGSTAG
jgi:hypothetical protein